MQQLLEARSQEPQAIPGLRRGKRGPKPFRGQGELWDLKDRYLGWMIATRYAEETIRGAHSDLSWFLRYLELRGLRRIADVTTEILKDYSLWLRETKDHRHEGKAISLGHICHRLVGVKNFFKWLSNEMIVLSDPAEDLELPRLNYGLPQQILTQEEARRILEVPNLRSPLGYRDRAVLEVLYATGLRIAEFLRLRVEDVDLNSRTLFVRQGKGGKDRIIPVPVLPAGYLREYLQAVRPKFAKATKNGDSGALWLNWNGAGLTEDRLRGIIKNCVRAAGIDRQVTPMTFRHSIASHLLENGMDVRAIQEFLGHDKLSTTQVYAKVTLSGLRKHYNKHHPKERRVRSLGI